MIGSDAASPGVAAPQHCYFGPPARPLSGWYHPASPGIPSRSTGVVLCAPLGYEAMCAYRSLRHFAVAAASAGFPTLRFDYDGTGDSAGEDLDPDRWLAWQRSVEHAIDELRRRAGATHICLLGVRLGATIAVHAARRRQDIAGLVAIAPVVSGRAWLREMRALHATMGRPEAPTEFTPPPGVTESAGLLLDGDARKDIDGVDLQALGSMPARECLVLDRNDRPSSDEWCHRLRESGARVRHAVLPGYVEMTLDPHEAQVPTAMIGSFTDWLTSRFPEQLQTTPAPAPESNVPVPVAEGVDETAIVFGGPARLFGVLTSPRGDHPDRALLLLNAGANHHVGNGRMYVKFARRLARKGWLVLRYDVSGIGDSPPHPDARENIVYTPHAVGDLKLAIDHLRGQRGGIRIEVMGLCSGAYHGYKGAVASLPIAGVTIVNPLVFFWKEGMTLSYPPFLMVQAAAQYQESLLRLSKWVKLLRGQVQLQPILAVLAHRSLARANNLWRNLRRASGFPIREDLGAELQGVAKQGPSLRFVFSAGDPGEVLLRGGAGWALRPLERSGRAGIAHLSDCDHSLSSAWMHEALWKELARELDAA